MPKRCSRPAWAIVIHEIQPSKKTRAMTRKFCSHADAKRAAATFSRAPKVLAVEIKSFDKNGFEMHHGEFQRGRYWAW
jgi:hypothetical protein